jgi:DNA-binding XRE family transcriptional regulator
MRLGKGPSEINAARVLFWTRNWQIRVTALLFQFNILYENTELVNMRRISKLKAARILAGFSQIEIAALIGTSQASISRLERAQGSLPPEKLEALKKILEYPGVSEDQRHGR